MEQLMLKLSRKRLTLQLSIAGNAVQAFCEMTSHKLQQKQIQLILFHDCVLIDRKKVLRNPLGGKVMKKPQNLTLLLCHICVIAV